MLLLPETLGVFRVNPDFRPLFVGPFPGLMHWNTWSESRLLLSGTTAGRVWLKSR